MNREYQLDFCQTCKNQKFSMQKGIICSLTDEQATFKTSCLDYIEDPVEKEKHENRKQQRRDLEAEEDSMGLTKSFGTKNGVLAGQAAIGVAILWFVVGYFILNRIFFYPFILFGMGVISWVKGEQRKNEKGNDSKK